jgi:hypothetical protein
MGVCRRVNVNLSCIFLKRSPDSLLRFLYTLFLAMDANFKLKGKDRGINDPELAPGWASFVEETRFQEYIKNHVEQPEVRIA